LPMPPAPKIITPPPPAFTPPERPVLERAAGEDEINGARVTKVASTNTESDETAEDLKAAREQRRKAIGDMVNSWGTRAPQTTVVIEPAALKQGADDPATAAKAAGKAAESAITGKVLVPAGREIFAHTVVAVDSDTNGPIVLEADTGPISGDRMIGSFSKSGNDRLIVKIESVEHRGTPIDANGLVIAPDSMETAVASSIDEHYLERFALPAAAAFMSGLGQAAALSNSTSTVSPFGGTTQTFGNLNFGQQAMVAGGAAASAVSTALNSEVPKGPTVHLAANVSVGVMFLSNLTAK
jgi:intracellular multiplication protein IcmE